MFSKLKSFLAVVEEGSLHRAASRLSISQSSLSRQMQALEHEMGGKLLQRTSTGVTPTNAGLVLSEKAGSLLKDYETMHSQVRRQLRGESDLLRIGYIGSAAQDYLYPALAILRQSHPETKVKLSDFSPGEQVDALRQGKIDLAITDQVGDLLSRDFYTRKIGSMGSVVILPASHPLASRKAVRLVELKGNRFVSGTERDMPGYDRRLTLLCRKLGNFRPQFVGEPENLAERLALVANEEAVAIMPDIVRHRALPTVVILPLSDSEVIWDMLAVWRERKMTGPLRVIVNALSSLKNDTSSVTA